MQYYNPTFYSSCPTCNPAIVAQLKQLSSTPMITGMNNMDRDIRYMKRYYPNEVQRLAEIVTTVLDKYDTGNSFIYDEFPDRISTLHILKEILSMAEAENIFPSETDTNSVPYTPINKECRRIIAEILLSHEIFLRRTNRKRTHSILF